MLKWRLKHVVVDIDDVEIFATTWSKRESSRELSYGNTLLGCGSAGVLSSGLSSSIYVDSSTTLTEDPDRVHNHVQWKCCSLVSVLVAQWSRMSPRQTIHRQSPAALFLWYTTSSPYSSSRSMSLTLLISTCLMGIDTCSLHAWQTRSKWPPCKLNWIQALPSYVKKSNSDNNENYGSYNNVWNW